MGMCDVFIVELFLQKRYLSQLIHSIYIKGSNNNKN